MMGASVGASVVGGDVVAVVVFDGKRMASFWLITGKEAVMLSTVSETVSSILFPSSWCILAYEMAPANTATTARETITTLKMVAEEVEAAVVVIDESDGNLNPTAVWGAERRRWVAVVVSKGRLDSGVLEPRRMVFIFGIFVWALSCGSCV
jgi:hypothetical protein